MNRERVLQVFSVYIQNRSNSIFQSHDLAVCGRFLSTRVIVCFVYYHVGRYLPFHGIRCSIFVIHGEGSNNL